MTDPLDRLRDAVRAMDFVDERMFEETTTLHEAWESARYDGRELNVDRVKRVRDSLPNLLSALETARDSIDLVLEDYT